MKRIHKHRKLVRKYCFRLGLYVQGITHDLSKYTPQEFLAGAKYYSDERNPIASERNDKGISEAWLHHKGRNKHHPEYWVDYRFEADGPLGFGSNKMPRKYVLEMFCDYIASSRIYLGDSYTDRAPLDRFCRDSSFKMIHTDSAKELEGMLEMLSERGEEETFKQLRKHRY